ncbi:teichoic acid transport system ATP-binding protein [Natronobacillus azotifigens]|uniref:ATP-binding cassette domain-containing protein n=1 Tax=Natronobacillus azotifigens TaxID=472978 RepID=A0A9J6RE79_9BACI|nr:ATP-binding cassette domain-containing protein [Natronobacillus azotifigens]MCZ0703686.1 ATP-binding cassette domain-containing protein [Natronobacillus azotifigens]
MIKNYSKEFKNTDQVVLGIDKLGVAYKEGNNKDDYKSHAIDFFKGKKTDKDKKIWPLKDISFTGYKGEVIGIIGKNGSGKTTLCKVISDIILPDEGEVFVNGKVSALFSLGMGFNKELTGRENVYLNGMMLGITKKTIEQHFDVIHEFSGIGSFIDQPMKKYSSGMRARLGFSVAAHLEPEILILDEALNTGDKDFSAKAEKKIKELVQKAKLVIVVTHSLKFAEKNCTRLIWLEKGQIRKTGNPLEIITEYKDTMPKKGKIKKKLDLKKTESKLKDTPVVEMNNVSVNYRINKEAFYALKNINIKINEGEVVGIIGHNGAGKSTLCKVLTKIIKPDDGDLYCKGETTALLGYGTGFNAQLTGKDNIYLNGMLLGIPLQIVESNYQSIVDFSELGGAIEKSIKEYSSGMKARLGFSIAAVLKPDIFIIDEALSTGDIAFRQKASEKIQEMMESAKAVIIVTHSMSFVEKVCTRAIWFDQGTVRLDGKPEEVVLAYKENKK